MKTQFGELVTADLHEGTLTIEVGEEIIAQAGKYAIVPIEDYEKLVNGVGKSIKQALNLTVVIKRAFAYLLILPTALIYFMLLLIINPIQYLFIGKAYIAQKFHKYIAKIIERHGL